MTTAELTTEDKAADKLIARFVDESNKAWDKREPELLEKLEKQIVAKMEAKALEAAKKNSSGVIPGLAADAQEVKDYRFSRLIRGIASIKDGGVAAFEKIAPLEYRLHLEAMKTKDQASSTDSAGGYLVPAQVMQAQIIPYLQEQLSLTLIGATFLNDLSGSPVEIPKRTSGTTAYWINHDVTSGATAPSVTDMTFGQVRMAPKTVAARSRLSNRLVQQSTPAAETIVKDQIIYDLAGAEESAAWNGSGADGQPRGILQTDNILTQSVGSVSASTAYDALVDMEQKLRAAFSLRGNVRWVMNSAIYAAMLKVKDPTDGSQPKARRLMTETGLTKLMGRDYTVTDLCPANTLLLGNMSELLIGHWGGLTVNVDSLSVLGLQQMQIMVAQDVDIQVRHPESFVKGTSVTV
jgi:HK97 family phage major capsid protein